MAVFIAFCVAVLFEDVLSKRMETINGLGTGELKAPFGAGSKGSFKGIFLNRESERIPRCLLRGLASESENEKLPYGEDSPWLAAGRLQNSP
jgi:hypothetical protein